MKYPARRSFPWLTVFGLGRMRPASGTWGSLPPVIIAGLLIATGFGPENHPVLFSAILATVACVFAAACVLQGDQADLAYGKDPSVVVADEMAGQSIALLLLPASAIGGWEKTCTLLLVAFLAFRVMDIIKPWPARQIQTLPGGWGILLDDVFAGFYAMLVVQWWAYFGPGSR
jgi:phosphatidylglycerophosphatase A